MAGFVSLLFSNKTMELAVWHCGYITLEIGANSSDDDLFRLPAAAG